MSEIVTESEVVEVMPTMRRHSSGKIVKVCGYTKRPRQIDLAGRRFGKLVVVKRGPKHGRNTTFLCRCDCGKEKIIRASSLKCGYTKSCGCLNGTHRLIKTQAYRVWSNMLTRCRNRNNRAFKNYGGRGIQCAKRWLKFEKFLADMGHPPSGMTLERIDNNKGYSKVNCCWADRIAQANNTRATRRFRVEGKWKTITELAKEHGVNRNTIATRLSRGQTIHQALQRAN